MVHPFSKETPSAGDLGTVKALANASCVERANVPNFSSPGLSGAESRNRWIEE
jgi:hypothetical protein